MTNNEYLREWRKRNPEKVKEYRRRARERNPEKEKEYRLNSLRRKAIAEICKNLPIQKGDDLFHGTFSAKEGS